jgi:hypothetical protein
MQLGYYLTWKRCRPVSSIVVICCVVFGCKSNQLTAVNVRPTPSPAVTSPADEQAAALRELHVVGKKIVSAVLAKDGDALLPFDRDDLRLEDEAALKDKNGNLYCYLFGSNCIPGSNVRTVYEKLSTAQQPEIDASVMRSPDGKLYGLLIFYDKSQISEKHLNSRFVCTDKGLRMIASWHFVLVNGKWSAATPLFDMDTDGLC